MKKIIKLLPMSLMVLPIIPSISSCSCAIAEIYTAISSEYLNIDNTYLNGFKADKLDEDLSRFDTLQVLSNITKVGGFNKGEAYKSYKAIKNIIGDNNGKWTDIESLAFSSLPSLTKIILPKTVKNIATSAFNYLPVLSTLDLSNIEDITIIKSEQFAYKPDLSKQKLDGTIIVKSQEHKTTLTKTFENNDWLKNWTIVIKN